MFPSRPRRPVRHLLLVPLAMLPLACGLKGEPQTQAAGAGPPPGVAAGAVQVMLTGTGFGGGELEDVAQVNVTLAQTIAFPDEGSGMPGVSALGPTPLLGAPVTLELLSLQGNTMTLAAGPVAAAHYNRVELQFTGASVTLRNGGTNALGVEGGTVDVPINVTVDPGQTAFINLSINVRDSVRLNKNDQGTFRPIVRVP
ncbi:MAG TPA: DUF4382 domain-containing protein [Candidatus Polarisedimenticolia bacterium]|nr:DUF4382 domain-containing protein [Candidatus Polarisedimenticolia bacterium]